MNNKELLDALVANSLITSQKATQLLSVAVQTGRLAEDLVYADHIVKEEAVAGVKSATFGIPFKTVEAQTIKDSVLQLVPADTAQTYQLAPLELNGSLLVVGMVHPDDTRAQEALRFIAKQRKLDLGIYIITPTNLSLILRRYFPYESEIAAALRSLGSFSKSGAQMNRAVALEEMSKNIEEDAPIIKIVSATLRAAVEQKASDVHIEPQRTRSRVRFRLDGELKEVASFPIEIHNTLISRVKILSNLKIDETRVPQDGRFRSIIFGKDIDFRVSTFPTPTGEKVAIRVLDPSVGLKGIDSLGLQGKNADLVKEALNKPYGMVLLTGPTGSGKTTTLYALLQILNSEDVNVLSLEDPVEYFVDGINQSQVKPEIGYTFANGLRQTLRQDPDIIMVGEIRDSETAELAVQAALTGHIVLSTLHTNTAIGVIPRLIDMKVEPFLISSALNLMISQRLVRKLCSKCRQAKEAPKSIQTIIAKEMAALPDDVKKTVGFTAPYVTYSSAGCEACKGKGVEGRLALFEVVSMSRELEKLIVGNFSQSELQDAVKKQGIVTLRQDGILKALQGIVGIEEVLRESEES